MSRVNENDARAQSTFLIAGWKMGRMETIPANGFVIAKDMPPIIDFTPAGAINVLMPASTDETRGLCFLIKNTGAGGIITLQTSGGAAFATAITIPVSNGWVLVQCTGSTTANLGWKLVAGNLP